MSFSLVTSPGPPSLAPAKPHLQLQPQSRPQFQQPPQQRSPSSSTTPRTLRRPPARKASGIAKINTTSTPNLRGAYVDSTKPAPAVPLPLPLPVLQRKASQAALTPNTLAAVPDASESYALTTLNGSPPPSNNKMLPLQLASKATNAPQASGDILVGDTVEVPGDMQGTVRFVGTIPGKKGTFAGVELRPEYAPRGKNSGDVDGVSYFTTGVPGAGVFLPLSRAVKRDSAPASATSSYPMTPASTSGLKAGNQNSTNHTPPTPSMAQFGKSVGPAGRASSPLTKKPRPSLGRPESPTRKLQLNTGGRPSIGGTPGKMMPRPDATARYGSPTQNKFSQSARGPTTPGDPAKRGMLLPGRKNSIGPRSSSALSARSVGHGGEEEYTPMGNGIAGPRDLYRPGSALRRGPSRQATAQDEEVERLRAEIASRDRQLQEQSATLTEMENSLTEVQSLLEQSELPGPTRDAALDDKDTAQLRALVQEKNDKIAMLTAEFDAHRADFRSTIDTLELASTETERVYEKRIEELMQDLHSISERDNDVDAVATQLKQLEELVQELEEGLEDARRGEAEARGEVEFLRGEVERTRAELRREREKAATNGADGAGSGDHSAPYQELEKKEDEIRGLKAIIHSLHRDSVPGDGERPPVNVEDTAAREKLEREVAELRALLDTKNSREDELEHELEDFRRSSAATVQSNGRSSARDSRDTVVLATDLEARSNDQQSLRMPQHQRVRTLDSKPESDGLSSITEHSTLWCELCEASGHDILTCTNMFGSQGAKAEPAPTPRPLNLAPAGEGERKRMAPLSARLPPPPSPPKSTPAPPVRIHGPPPSLMDPGPVAGKESGIIDPEAWCALCEKDGHNSVDCPFEDAF